MVKWQTPKTNWYGAMVNGEYTGDRFNSEDYNRIKNNLLYLQTVVSAVLSEIELTDMGADKTKLEYFYADEINKIENNLRTLTNRAGISAGTTQHFSDNGRIFDYNELNRIERATLDVYNKLFGRYANRRKLTFKLGDRGGF